MKIRIALVISVIQAFLLVLSGCATTGKSIGAGGVGGATLGAGVGALADPGPDGENRVRNILIGTAAGGAVGAGAGYLVDRYVKEGEDEAYKKGKGDVQKEIFDQTSSSNAAQPRLIPPRTEARWIPDQVRGNIFVPGHFEYVIIEGAKWETKR